MISTEWTELNLKEKIVKFAFFFLFFVNVKFAFCEVVVLVDPEVSFYFSFT